MKISLLFFVHSINQFIIARHSPFHDGWSLVRNYVFSEVALIET